MNTSVSDESLQISNAVNRLLSKEYTAAQRTQALSEPSGTVPGIWKQLAGMGVLAMPVPEQYGGFNTEPADSLPVFREYGSALLVAPWLSHMLGLIAIRHAGSSTQKERYLAAAAQGIITLGYAINDAYDIAEALDDATLRDLPTYQQKRVSGVRRCVLYGDTADHVIVDAVDASTRQPLLLIVDTKASGIRHDAYRMTDGSFAHDVYFDDVEAEELGDATDSHGATRQLIQEIGIAALAYETLGIVEETFEQTVNYLNVRKQFDQPLARYQAVQHRAAEMFVKLEQIRSMAQHAARMLSEPDSAKRAYGLSQVKLLIGRYGKWITQQAIQLHGGIGMTDEHMIGHFYKRMLMIDQTFGSERHHLRALASTVA